MEGLNRIEAVVLKQEIAIRKCCPVLGCTTMFLSVIHTDDLLRCTVCCVPAAANFRSMT